MATVKVRNKVGDKTSIHKLKIIRTNNAETVR